MGHETKDFASHVGMVWKNEVPDDKSSRNIPALVVYADVSNLAMHLDERTFGHLNIISDSRELHGNGFICISKIAQVDVHDSIQKSERRRLVVAARIVDNGDMQPLPARCKYCCEHLGDLVGGCDKVDIVGSLCLKLDQRTCEPFNRHLRSMVQLTQRIVLAIAAIQVATAEKDCT